MHVIYFYTNEIPKLQFLGTEEIISETVLESYAFNFIKKLNGEERANNMLEEPENEGYFIKYFTESKGYRIYKKIAEKNNGWLGEYVTFKISEYGILNSGYISDIQSPPISSMYNKTVVLPKQSTTLIKPSFNVHSAYGRLLEDLKNNIKQTEK